MPLDHHEIAKEMGASLGPQTARGRGIQAMIGGNTLPQQMCAICGDPVSPANVTQSNAGPLCEQCADKAEND